MPFTLFSCRSVSPLPAEDASSFPTPGAHRIGAETITEARLIRPAENNALIITLGRSGWPNRLEFHFSAFHTLPITGGCILFCR